MSSSSNSFPNIVWGSWKPTVFRSCQRPWLQLCSRYPMVLGSQGKLGTQFKWDNPTNEMTMVQCTIAWDTFSLISSKIKKLLEDISTKQVRPPTWLLYQNSKTHFPNSLTNIQPYKQITLHSTCFRLKLWYIFSGSSGQEKGGA